MTIPLLILLFWILPGMVSALLISRINDGTWNSHRGQFAILTLVGLLSVLFLIMVVFDKLKNTGFWSKKLIERDPYKYHKY